MKHCIIVKWKPEVDKVAVLPEVKELFATAKDIDGVSGVEFIENVVDKPNRYNLMIRVLVEKDKLQNWNDSATHKAWLENYGDKLESKAIFDYE